MMDLIMPGIAVTFFVSTWGLLKLCEILGRESKGDNV
jgi:hypothetical protein